MKIRLACVLVFVASLAQAQEPTPLDLVNQLRSTLDQLALKLTPPSATTITVQPGADLQAVIDGAPAGAVIQLTPGLYRGAVTITKAVTLRSTAPLPDRRLTPADAALLPKLQAVAGQTAGITVKPGATEVHLDGLELLPTPCFCGQAIYLEGGDDLALDRLYIHGDPVMGMYRGIKLDSGKTSITRSYISDIKGAGEPQAIAGHNGPGPYVITDNYLEASGENIIIGGGDPAVTNQVPSNITITNNTLFKPIAWRAAGWGVKNLFELKNARHVTFTGNTLSGSWTQGQVGYGIVLTPRNQDGGCPWCIVEDVLIAHNTMTNVGGGFQILGEDYTHPSAHLNLIRIEDNTIEIVRELGAGNLFQISSGPTALQIRRNVVTEVGLLNAMFAFSANTPKTAGLVVEGNRFPQGEYGIHSPEFGLGKATLDGYAPGYAWTMNTIIKGTSPRTIPYPSGTTVQ